jgi:hypothetical protein
MLPPTEREGALSRFRLADWIVPPVVIPLFLLLFILVVVFLNGR